MKWSWKICHWRTGKSWKSLCQKFTK